MLRPGIRRMPWVPYWRVCARSHREGTHSVGACRDAVCVQEGNFSDAARCTRSGTHGVSALPVGAVQIRSLGHSPNGRALLEGNLHFGDAIGNYLIASSEKLAYCNVRAFGECPGYLIGGYGVRRHWIPYLRVWLRLRTRTLKMGSL